jgi:hypothetical protein
MPRPSRPALAPFLLALAIALAATAGPARAAIPNADNLKAFTDEDYKKAKLEFGKRTLTGVYQTLGRRDPKWDAAAVKFLDAMAVYFSYRNADSLVAPTVEVPTDEEFAALGRAAANAGCDDPLVTYCRAVILNDAGRPNEAGPLCERAVKGMGLHRYPPHRITAAANRLIRLFGNRPGAEPHRATFEKVVWDHAIATAATPLPGGAPAVELRLMLEHYDDVFEAATPDRKLEFCKAVEAAKTADPWVVNYLYGRYELKAGWHARGSGFAHTVGEDGWKRFYAHLGRARDYLVKAHTLRPDLPEAATLMITVALGAGDQINEKPRDWFDKAAKAQFDYFPAYHAYTWSLYPRWGGSHQEMFKFGVECMLTDRYDTFVPYRLMVILDSINEDSDNDFAIYRTPAVKAAVRQVLTKMSEKAPQPHGLDYYQSALAAVAWLNGDYAEAAAVLDRVGPKADSTPFAQFRAWPPLAISQIRAMTTPQSRGIAVADRLLAAGDLNAAAVAYGEAAKRLPKDHPGQFFVRFRVREIGIRRDFDAGKAVDLKPDADLLPWEAGAGQWKLDKDGAFVATSDAQGQAVLTCRVDFGPDYEVQARFSAPNPAWAGSGILYVERWDPQRWTAAALDLDTHTAWAFGPGGRSELKLAADAKEHAVVVRVSNGHFTVTVDGKTVAPAQPLSRQTPEDGALLALGINGGFPGGAVRFRDVQIRRIDPAKK